MLGIIGIIVGVALLIYGAYRGVSIIVLAPIGFIVFSALHEISSLSGRPGQCISAQISPQLIKIRIKSFQTTIRFFKTGFRRNQNIFVQNADQIP